MGYEFIRQGTFLPMWADVPFAGFFIVAYFLGFYLITSNWAKALGCTLVFSSILSLESLAFAPLLFGFLVRDNKLGVFCAVVCWTYFSAGDCFLGLLLALVFKPHEILLWTSLAASLFLYPVPESRDYPAGARLAEVSKYNQVNEPYIGSVPFPSPISEAGVSKSLKDYRISWSIVVFFMLFVGRVGLAYLVLLVPFIAMCYFYDFLRLVPGQGLHASAHAICALTLVLFFSKVKLFPYRTLFFGAVLALSLQVLDYSHNFGELVLKTVGDLELDRHDSKFVCEQSNLRRLPGVVSAQEVVVDGDLESRWTGKNLKFELSNQEPVYALRFSVGVYTTDFPTAFSVFKGENLILEVKNWKGTTRWTESGFSFFDAPHNVLVRFEEPLSLGDYSVVLDSPEQYFDWSVAEIEAYGTKCLK